MLTPILRNFRRVRLRWLFRERALRAWVSRMMRAARSTHWLAAVRESHHDWTNAEAAVRIWQTVSSGFFPPPLLMHAGEKQVGQGRDRLMTHQANLGTAFKMIEAQFRFLVLKRALHAPPREGHVQQYRQPCVLRCFRNEELEHIRLQHAPGNDQVHRRHGQVIFAVWVTGTSATNCCPRPRKAAKNPMLLP